MSVPAKGLVIGRSNLGSGGIGAEDGAGPEGGAGAGAEYDGVGADWYSIAYFCLSQWSTAFKHYEIVGLISHWTVLLGLTHFYPASCNGLPRSK